MTPANILGRRRRGELDLADLFVGLGLLVGVPIVVYFGLKMTGAIKTKSDLMSFRNKPEVTVPTDDEEVRMRMEFIQRLYTENAREYVRRFQSSTGSQRERERQWALTALSRVQAELSRLETFINATPETKSRYQAQLTEIQRFRETVRGEQAQLNT